MKKLYLVMDLFLLPNKEGRTILIPERRRHDDKMCQTVENPRKGSRCWMHIRISTRDEFEGLGKKSG